METVKFTRYPRSGKKLFKTGPFKQKPVSAAEADKKIKEFAKTLSQNQTEDIAFVLTFDADDPEEARDYQIETVIDSSDADEGLMGVVRRDTANEDLTEEEQADIDDLDKELQDQLIASEDEDLEENDDFVSDLNETNDNSDLAVEVPIDHPVDNSGNNMFVPDFTPSQIDVSKGSDEPVFTPSDADETLPDPDKQDDSLVLAPSERAAPDGATKELELNVKSSGEFEDATDILSRVPDKYDVDQFDLENIKQQLGYQMQPKDKFDKELNRIIDKTIKDQGLDKIKSDYDVALASLKNGVIDSLTSEYNRINHDTVDNAVENNLADKISDLENEAKTEKAQNEANAQQAIANEQEKTDADVKAKLNDYKIMLETQAKDSMRQFTSSQNDKVLQLNDRVDKQLNIDKTATRKRERAKVVNQRNQDLADVRTKINNSFLQGVQDRYLNANNDFSTKVDTLVLKVQEAQEELDQKREDYEAKQAELKAKNKANELKERELDQKQDEIEMTRKQVEGLPDAIAKAVQAAQQVQVQQSQTPAQGAPIYTYSSMPVSVPGQTVGVASNPEFTKILEKMNDIQRENSDIKNALALNKRQEEIDSVKKELATTKKKNKRWAIGLVTFLGVAALSSLLVFGYEKTSQQSQAKQPTIVLQAKSAKSRVIKSKPVAKNENQAKSESTVVKTKTPFEKYQDLKNWSEKRDFLNGLLGQHDSRTLEMIVKEDPTNLAKLYLAISNNDDAKIRNAWNQMTIAEQSEATAGARNTVAIAFYNVKDWEKGYEARYAR